MKKATNTYHVCLSIIMAIIVVTAFTINLREIDYAMICKWVNSDNILAWYIAKWRYILSGYGMYNSLFVLALAVLLYKISWETKFKTIRDYSIMILAAVFSVFMIVGHSYSVSNSWKLAFGGIFYISVSVVRFIGFFISFYYGIRWLSYQMQLKENQLYFYADQKANAITIWLFEKHSWGGGIFLVIAIIWLPYLIACFPGVVQWDSFRQLENFAHLAESNNNHPVFTTLLMGFCMNMGKKLGNDNLGVFFYILPQYILCAFVFTKSICFLKRFNSPYWLRWGTLLYFSFIPLWPLYAVSLFKDTLFYIIFLCYVMFIIQALIEKEKFWRTPIKLTCFIICMILLTWIRSNGIHVVMLSLPLLMFVARKHTKKVTNIIVFGAVLGAYFAMNSILLSVLGVAPGNKNEMLSIPFQQTARYVVEYGDEVTEEERGAISKVLDYDKLAENYDPQFADPVKNSYNFSCTDDDLLNYFKIWLKQFIKHPTVYVQATLNGSYGYFYPNKTEYREGLGAYSITYVSPVYTGRFEVTMNDGLLPVREILENLSYVVRQIPGIGLVFSNGIYTWLLLLGIVLLFQRSKYRCIIPFIPCVLVVLVCVASPVNAYIRYMRPVMAAMPLLIAWTIYVVSTK